jgi:hypothetical protein
MHRWKRVTTLTKEEEEERGDHCPRMMMTPHKRLLTCFTTFGKVKPRSASHIILIL